MAPEVLAGKSYNESADIYSLGIVMWELLTAQCPFDGVSQMAVRRCVCSDILTAFSLPLR